LGGGAVLGGLGILNFLLLFELAPIGTASLASASKSLFKNMLLIATAELEQVSHQ
jgi:hypothetical protein